jgi:prepilin-type processing-associated H-X9-DG protein
MAETTQGKAGRAIVDLIAVFCILFVVGILLQPLLARSQMNPGCTCQSNLKQLAKAFSLYTGDWNRTLPSSYLYGHSQTWNPDDFVRFAKEQGSLPPKYGQTGLSWPLIMSPYLPDRECLWCPSDRGRSSSPTARISYYWKAALDRAWYGDASTGAFKKDWDFNYPGEQIILYERNSWHYGRGNTGPVNGALINCAFMDGHVGTLEIRDSGYALRESPPEPLPASGVGEPAWFNYSIADSSPRFDRGQNWNPRIWADRMREIPSDCDDPETTCQDNLKRLGIAVLMYAGDWDGAMPSSCLYGHSSAWNTDDFVGFASERGTLPPPSGATQLTWPMVLYPYIRSDRVLWCPLDEGKSRNPSARVSYYWKAAVDRAWYGNASVGAFRKQEDFNYPGDQIVIYERNGWHGPGRNRGLTDGVAINCAYMDGHVGLRTIRDSGYGRREIPAGPLPMSGVGEPAWFNYPFGDANPAFSKGQNWDPGI